MADICFNRCPKCNRTMVRMVGIEPYWRCDCGYMEEVNEPLIPITDKDLEDLSLLYGEEE